MTGIIVNTASIARLAGELDDTVRPALHRAMVSASGLAAPPLPPPLAAANARAARDAETRLAERLAGLGLIRRALTETARTWSECAEASVWGS